MRKAVLDMTAGSRMSWFSMPGAAVFCDIRREVITVPDSSMRSGERVIEIQPDVLTDFCALPFADGSFSLVYFDPPHLRSAGPRSWLRAKYGVLGDDWREVLRLGFGEAWRVLAPGGTLVFKWATTQVRLRDVRPFFPAPPMFGARTTKRAIWLVFWKAEVGDCFAAPNGSARNDKLELEAPEESEK